MSRIQSTFSALAAQHKKGLIPFITAGDPSPQLTVPLMHALVAGGSDDGKSWPSPEGVGKTEPPVVVKLQALLSSVCTVCQLPAPGDFTDGLLSWLTGNLCKKALLLVGSDCAPEAGLLDQPT